MPQQLPLVPLTSSLLVALTSGSEAALAAVKGITPAIIAAGNTATKDVYASGFRLIFLVSLAFAGTHLPFPLLPQKSAVHSIEPIFRNCMHWRSLCEQCGRRVDQVSLSHSEIT